MPNIGMVVLLEPQRIKGEDLSHANATISKTPDECGSP